MYYILVFSGTWSLYDVKNSTSRLLEVVEWECLRSLFSATLGGNLLTAMQLNVVPLNKVQAKVPPESSLSFLLAFPDNWILYNAAKRRSQLLNEQHVEYLKRMFSRMLTGEEVTALQVSAINPNKLLSLPAGGGQAPIKKEPETPSKR